MAGRGAGPDFVESLARGLDVLQCFDAERSRMSLSEVAAATGLARPTARRRLLTLQEPGFVRLRDGQFSLTPRVLSLGIAFVASPGLWEVGRPHLERLVATTGESSSGQGPAGRPRAARQASGGGPGLTRPGARALTAPDSCPEHGQGVKVRQPQIGTGTAGPLAGIVVADFSRVLAGPYATMLLGDLGAEVIKVESPAGDDTRHWVPPVRGETGTYYLAVNRNKRSIVLDLKDGDDLAVAHALSARADVLIQNFKPGGLDRFGLGYEAVAARNPRSIYCSISGFGSTGGAALPGYDLLVQGMSGLMSITGGPDGPPYRSGISVFDIMTGLHSAIGILAALHHRDAAGEGQLVETDLLSAALSTMANQTSAYIAGGVVPHRMGNSHLSLFPYEPLATSDGEIIVAAGNNAQFRRLCEAIGAPELADEERFATVGLRNDHRDELRPLLLGRLAQRSAADWFAILTKAGVPCGPINDVRGGVELAESLGLDPVVLAGDIPTVRNPVRLSATPARYDLPPPALDADGAEVRAWLAGAGGRAGQAGQAGRAGEDAGRSGSNERDEGATSD